MDLLKADVSSQQNAMQDQLNTILERLDSVETENQALRTSLYSTVTQGTIQLTPVNTESSTATSKYADHAPAKDSSPPTYTSRLQ